MAEEPNEAEGMDEKEASSEDVSVDVAVADSPSGSAPADVKAVDDSATSPAPDVSSWGGRVRLVDLDALELT